MFFRFIRRNYLHFLTMPFCVLIACLAAIIYMKYFIGMDSDHPDFQYVMKFVRPPYFLALLILYVLIFSRKSRDEYFEKIWQRSMRAFGVVIFIVPWIWLSVWYFKKLFFHDSRWLPLDPNELILPFRFDNPQNASELQMSGVEYLMGQFWIYSPVLFVVLFNWHAWRDRD